MSDLVDLDVASQTSPPTASIASTTTTTATATTATTTATPTTSTTTGQVADVNAFMTYLKQFVPAMLDSNLASANDFEKCLNDKSSVECVKKFIAESQIRTLIIQKFITKDDEETEQVGSDDLIPAQYLISTEVHYTNPKCLSVQIIKRGAIIESDKKFHNQLRVISLADSSPYETLHSYVSHTLAPYFKSYVKRGSLESQKMIGGGGGGGGGGGSGSGGGSGLDSAVGRVLGGVSGVGGGIGSDLTGSGSNTLNASLSSGSSTSSTTDQFASLMEKRIAEVEMGFLHLQQNIEIPEINLIIHPVVLQMIKKCNDESRKPRVDDFSDKVEDTNFLNQLQSGVSRWIREIKKVTKLDRDPSTGTALQEISFWLNLERALNRILEKRESIEVTLTLDILRYGKRFIATVSFDSDTGLKEALETAKDYNLLMKDFPLNELMSATELNKITLAIQSIFNHLKKIRNSKYPLNRALKLIEAISKDLTSQLLKVLSTQRLMSISFDDFEKTMKSCFSVFTAWDDEYEKLQGILRELAKRKRDEFKMVWRINPSHKRLQNRLVVMQNFRRQHDQLRLVINRVLRPAMSQESNDESLNALQSTSQVVVVVAQRSTSTTNDISAGLDVADANAIEEVSLAYEKVKEVDALDISEEGQELWESAIRRYDERIERVEARMTARLRDQLGTAKNANEMFRIFSRFNALFVRPHIRGAIREYQTQLIQRVKDDIEALQEKFKAQYIQSKCYRMSKIRDIPPVAGSIIWAKQIERQLNMYMGRVEAVLGKGWETHVDGQKLKADGDSFRMKLNTQELFEDWARKVNQKNLQNSGRIFLVDTIRASKGTIYTLKVNFSPEIITLTKEARNMKWLVSRVPLAIVNKAHTARQMYPYAISLIENVSTYKRICERVNEKRTCQLLVAGMKKDIQNSIMDMSSLVWDSYKLESSVQKFADAIYNFREKVDELVTVESNIDQQLKELDTCAYNETKFADILYEIQKSIDYLNLKGFSNLPQWVAKLDEEVEKKFAQRLSLAIRAWIDVLLDRKKKQDDDDSTIIRRRGAGGSSGGGGGGAGGSGNNRNDQTSSDKFDVLFNLDDTLSGITLISGQSGDGFSSIFGLQTNSNNNNNNNTGGDIDVVFKISGEPKIKKIILEILIKNQVLYVCPSIEDAREHLISQLYEFSSVITTQKRIQHSRYQVTMEAESEYKITYKNLLNKFPTGAKLLEYSFSAIENLLQQAQEYIKVWLHFQSLWDLQPDTLYTKLSNNLQAWISCLNEMKESRKSFDTQETQRMFGPISIDYTKVQSKVNVKYDAWHKDVLSKFGSLLGNELQDFHAHVSKSRSDLESQSVEAASTSEAVSVITYVQALKRKLKDWEKKVEAYTDAQKILERQRYQFPSNWLYTDYIQGEWGAFNEILKRKDHSIQNQVASLQTKIISEEKIVESKTSELVHEWELNKPVNGTMKPDQALKGLQIFETKFNRIREERENMTKAKDALELRDNASSSNDVRLAVSIEELQDLKGVWSELAKIWSQIDEQKEKQWLTIQPRKLRATLDGLLNQMKDMPSRLRQYDSYNHVKKLLQDYLKSNALIVELRSEALKERHWKQLMKRMNVVWNLNDLTLGSVWDVNLLIYESTIKEILMVAQGEKALEEFLKQVSELWKNYSLELINYQNKCQIIRGWDDLFNKLKEHINSVSAMKLSPYYKEFEEEALSWEDKLNRINSVFDVWIDVQRRWVYLDGIFGGSADIKHLLPNETQKFSNVSSEFLTLMRKVSKSPLVLDILNIQGIQKLLERLADLLAKIQKALGEYLERERSSFPRFYFVGDEDLLEIIGNTKNVPRLQKHFKKMFAGVHSILLNEDNTIVLGVASKEGEEIIFKNPVSIAQNPKINDWLTLVEKEIRFTLASLLSQSVQESYQMRASASGVDREQYLAWTERYPAQLIVLSAQISWSESVENALKLIEVNPQLVNTNNADSNPLENVLKNVENTLKILADSVLQDQLAIRRRKLEHLIIEHVHQRDVIRNLISRKVALSKSFEWLSQMRFYFDPKVNNVLKQLSIQMANSKFHYGFEYLGVQDKLVQTPLTDRCYLTMTQALEARLGGSPFGPAGTGKTESVKALGHQLGQFVLVFNCDETFDFQAMGRIFVGLCQVGAWGCFDEFNRLEERMLSAVSQQIQTIQEALKEQQLQLMQQLDSKQTKPSGPISIELVGKQVTVNPHMAIFITMNPGYAGRSNLPDNLKKLFRSLAMTQPDNVLIAQVMLYSQGFRTAEKLAHKIVPFFKLCNEQLSSQSHYDFGLRSLKSVLVMAGNVKRERIQRIREAMIANNQTIDESKIAEDLNEQEILIQSIMESFVPRLINEDLPLLQSLLNDVFPGVKYEPIEIAKLKEEIKRVCQELHLVCGASADGQNNSGILWLEKVLQLYSISNLNHGLMMVGPSGSGKSTAWRVLLKSLERYEGIEGIAHVIDPKAISKDALYGSMDPNTREWTDGLFTHILRKIIDNVRGELNKRQWIIFDGDVDPEWVENLNSVLDDNKLLTLPNGERLNIPPNVRIMFEVQDLRYATLATVSRCGMIWFSEDVLTLDMIYENYFDRLCNVPLEGGDDDDLAIAMAAAAASSEKLKRSLSTPTAANNFDSSSSESASTPSKNSEISSVLADQRSAASYLRPFFTLDGIVTKCLEYAAKFEHIMDFTRLRALGSMFTMLNQCVRNVIVYNQQHDFRLSEDTIEKYMTKSLVLAVLWSFSGDCKLKYRCELGDFIRSSTTIQMPSGNIQTPVIDFEVQLTTGDWSTWLAKVPQIEVETHKVATPDVVVPTVDTIRHESLLFTWLSEHKPLLLCGPPGSGKTMTLFAALRSLPDLEVVGLNFSSATTPELMLKTFDHYCEYKRTPNGIVLAPIQLGKWLVIFCDEINLPDEDKYGTQRVISFIRQCIEHNGFYRSYDQSWVKLERIQFVGACNPPTDPGRKPLSHRFLRHVPLVYVDYPGELSLKQIYGTFNRAMLRIMPSLRVYAEPLTNAMVEFYLMSQERFTVDQQPHYIYSPREMTRWVRGICEAIRPLEHMALEDLVRLFVHEALRLFQDRLVTDDERQWTDENINLVASKHFSNMNAEKALKRPILYSNWLKKDYLPVDQEELREYVKARLKVFYEEELDVPLVLFNEVLDHVLRIDRIFRQPQGHLLLIGVSGAGKTTLSRFVAWINGLSVFQIKVHNNYSSEDFDDDLRNVLRRSGTKGEKIVFILDESNVLDSGFLERMNTLLANGEVPGLFEGDEYSTLMTQCKEGAQRDGLMLDSSEELYKWFTNEVMKNLHVVFTMNPSQDGLKNRAATSPALFNRCVLNWFGDWSHNAYYQVGKEFTLKIDLEKSDYMAPDSFKIVYDGQSSTPSHRESVVSSFVQIHETLHQANHKLQKKGIRTTTITPRHYLDFINHFAKLYNEKRSELEDQQVHLNIGLSKIRETVEQVEELQKSLAVKRTELEKKNNEANSKLKQMMNDQQEAEKKKVTSQELQQTLNQQLEEIAKKRASVMDDLSKVEPAVMEAQNAVKSIKKQHLVELKAMVNPPAAVKLGLESICLILNQETSDWRVIRGIIVRDNFISTIINFHTDNITPQIKEKMKTKFLNNPDYDFAKVNNASQACGPLVKWATAQIQYADMLHKVEPLREELKSLEDAAKVNELKAQDLENVISHLEKSISQYKQEYAELISQAQSIKSDLNSVESKVERSVALLKSLSNEQTRWESSSESFKVQMSTIVGDVVLSSALMAYAGYYDQATRNALFNTWISHLQNANIKFKEDLARIEYLSNADERMSWTAATLPTDDLCIENAIMLKRFNRYPLIIDPSGQATEFILNMYKDRKITKTSFLDNSFRKNLESALRFGNPILIQDVENYDPILNPVLNREIRRTGGRVLITLGDQDIDFSPMFTMFLSTRDPTVEFPPDICSRVTFVNFTVTRASLQAQCLHQVLKCERPDVEEKRLDLLKIQGEFQQRLRHLEKDLLRALNESKGKILNDDSIITRLENLKKEASEISRKVAETDQIMKEVETVINQYLALSQACSSIYFTMDILNQIHTLYQYSLQYFLEIFNTVLTQNINLKDVKDSQQRLRIIAKDLFYLAYYRLARGMLHDDRIVLALLFSKIYLKGFSSTSSAELNNIETDFRALMSPFTTGLISKEDLLPQKQNTLSAEQNEALLHLNKLSAFKSLNSDIKSNSNEFFKWLESANPELNVPQSLWSQAESSSSSSATTTTAAGAAVTSTSSIVNLNEINLTMKHLLLIKAFRPDRFIAMGEIFVKTIFGDEFMQQAEKMLDFANIVENEIKATTPILMCSVTGFDASGRVEDLAAESNKPLVAIAIGSSEGFTQAEKAINNSSKNGRWVLLKNVHLAPQWLVQLEKKLHNLQPHPGFRIFLAMEINPKIPSNLLRLGRCFVFEPPPGIKANLIRTMSVIPASRMNKVPAERSRLYFLLSWLHAITQERLRYVPLGWSKLYEFNESDLRCALDTIDVWIDTVAMGRTNLPPNKVPFDAIFTLMSECVYGGKIDNAFDRRLLNTFLKQLFSVQSFETDFKLVNDDNLQLSMPDAVKREQFWDWIENLKYQQTPSWLGLPNSAEKVLLTNYCNEAVNKLLKLSILDEEEEELAYESDTLNEEYAKAKANKLGDGRPLWMRQLHQSVTDWLKILPKQLAPIRRTLENIKDPLFRFFEREINTGLSLLKTVLHDLNDVLLICDGNKKQTNYHRQLLKDLAKGLIPKNWKRYTVPKNLIVQPWIVDFAERIKQMSQIAKQFSEQGSLCLKDCVVWLGGLFTPEAYITATRQFVAQANSWSLEELVLKISVYDDLKDAKLDDCSFALTGLKLQGAECKNNKINLSTNIMNDFNISIIKWTKETETSANLVKTTKINLPIYLNATRAELLFTINMETDQNEHLFYMRGVAILASNLN